MSFFYANVNRLMTTFDSLQGLDDGQFHRIVDALLRRAEPRYRLLRTHGLNESGQSIKGQPDSYVGNSARTCTIAFCYSTLKKNWWTKIVADIRDTIRLSPEVKEVVVATPCDVDRDGPKKEEVPWEDDARSAAGNAGFTIYDGRRLARLLDADHQDVRFEFLRIPFSRLSQSSVVASCQDSNSSAIADLKAKGRYSPLSYVPREADDELRRMWREALTPSTDGSGRTVARLIPVIADSGLWKSSLLCAFTESVAESVAVLLIQARDCEFNSEDALVRMVMQKLQGVIEQTLRIQEEHSITKLFSKSLFLTVALDGIDETRKPMEVASAIKFWLGSRIGKASVLIVSSRPDFWRRSAEQSWERYLPSSSQAASVGEIQHGERVAHQVGLNQPLLEPFTLEELASAWQRAGQSRESFDQLTPEALGQLRHPFTFHAYVEVAREKALTSKDLTGAGLVALWLKHRLKLEEDKALHLSERLYWNALIEIARLMQSNGDSVIEVDTLLTVPRFDAAHPPGPVVDRLIDSNILETLEGQSDAIRFVFDAVFEFFVGEADIEGIRRDRKAVVSSLIQETLSTTWTRLGRIGSQIAGTPYADQFLSDLIRRDYAMASVLMQSNPGGFSLEIRRQLFVEMRNAYLRTLRPERAFILERIGALDCEEARELLAELVSPANGIEASLAHKAAHSVLRLSLCAGAPLVAQTYCSLYHYYFREVLSLMRGSARAFRIALENHVSQSLASVPGTTEHYQAVTALAYLGVSEPLVTHLRERLKVSKQLHDYEFHALLALGSSTAGELFSQAVRQGASDLDSHGKSEGADTLRIKFFYAAAPRMQDLEYLVTKELEASILSLILDQDRFISMIGKEIASMSKRPSLIEAWLLTKENDPLSLRDFARHISPTLWIVWWNKAPSSEVRKRLLAIVGNVPDTRMEDCLIESLDDPQIRASAASALGRVGSRRCLPRLREALEEGLRRDPNDFGNYSIAHALGDLCDDSAINLLESLAINGNYPGNEAALESLALIRTANSGEALRRIASTPSLKYRLLERVIQALFEHGGDECIKHVLVIAKTRPCGAQWLVNSLQTSFMSRGWRAGEYHFLENDDIIWDYILEAERTFNSDDLQHLMWVFQPVDSNRIRRALHEFAARAGTSKDREIPKRGKFSALASYELVNRGDGSSVSNYIRSCLNIDCRVLPRKFETVQIFKPEVILSEVKRSLMEQSIQAEHLGRLLSIVGIVGTRSDVALLDNYLHHESERVRNLAYEAKQRLVDPLRLAAGWHEVAVGDP